MVKALVIKRMCEWFKHMTLPNHVIEVAGPPLSRQYLVSHPEFMQLCSLIEIASEVFDASKVICIVLTPK